MIVQPKLLIVPLQYTLQLNEKVIRNALPSTRRKKSQLYRRPHAAQRSNPSAEDFQYTTGKFIIIYNLTVENKEKISELNIKKHVNRKH